MADSMSDVTGLFLAAPSRVRTGEEFALGVKVLCEPYEAPAVCFGPMPAVGGRYNRSPRGITYMDNVPAAWEGVLELDGGDGYRGPSSFAFTPEHAGPYRNDHRPIARIQGISFSTPGIKFIEVRDAASGVQAPSNPIVVTDQEPDERLWWGDIHSQTFFSDGLRCPEELYAFARDEAFLDVFALSDHAESITDRQWDYFTAVTNDCYAPGSLVTLVGLEWTNKAQGHRNVYYPGASGPILRSNDPEQGQLEYVYATAQQHGALVIPHHSANAEMGVPWERGHDPEVERLCEIHSVWGNSERPAAAGNPFPIRSHGGEKAGQHVMDALRMGRRYGFIGGGDIHDGRPGDDLHNIQRNPVQYGQLSRQGIMGVWAPELTREAIFEALWNRRCYATMNARTYLEFSVCGAPMGQSVRASGTRPIRVLAADGAGIAAIEIVRNGEDWRRFETNERVVEIGAEDDETIGAAWYYARVTRTDGLMAWSSPVWVE